MAIFNSSKRLSMYYMIWNYTVDKAKQTKFEEEYGRSGSWYKFYEPCNDYMGLDLFKNTDGKSYMLIDKWMSKKDYESYIRSNQLEYDAIDNQSKELYETENQVGSYVGI